MRGASWWPSGLRARMVLAFVLVATVAAAAASGAGYAAARSSLIDETQQRAVDALRNQIGQAAPAIGYPPERSDLDQLRRSIGGDALITFEGLTSSAGDTLGLLSDDIRAAVAGGDDVVAQRVVSDAGPKLVLGTPIQLTELDGSRRDSGVRVYVVRDLRPTQEQLDRWERVVMLTIAAALPVAAVLALVISGSVLRPVRRLGQSARELAAGNLHTRLSPRGHDELAELATTFNHTAETLEHTVGELRDREAQARRFVGDVSHELRTPLTVLTSVMEMLENDAADRSPQDRELTTMAVGETRRLARLVEDLLEISRFDAGASALRLEEIDIGRAVADTLRTRGWTERVELTVPGVVRARVDSRRLDVAVSTLVANALHHGEPPVVIDVRADADDVTVSVTDHGPGLPDGDPDQVFVRFYKADVARARSDGSGLGLSIARANARLHGGDVTAADVQGAGARFVLRLPRGLKRSGAEGVADAEDDEAGDDDENR
ncbi:two-component system sensor histidine kinase MtrB [Haloactinopolyspora alba]|uniref:histidine kinase n=2 Tax=Haloactinopolyspora alba TaxID=648780 RepID=A0A2P8DWL2_9ACTN|nr:two-component system sensor histidine kinase MtrB [Haloactinopolyspora alba]